MVEEKELQLRTMKARIDGGFFWIEFTSKELEVDDVRLDIEEANEKLLAQNKEIRLNISDLAVVTNMPSEVRKLFASPLPFKYLDKTALIVRNPVTRVIGSFFMGINKPVKPTKMFGNVEDAKKWLKEE